jgi:pimeloyl-ACP methyl ester carboxylesterase
MATRPKAASRTAPLLDPSEFRLRHVNIHGHRVGFRMAGQGPAVVLVHGLAGSSTTWREVMPTLARDHTVIAPDLLGHGESAKPRGDYSLGAHASGVRDLLVALGVERATFVGHSLGGGIAMQLAYQYPQRCERLVLVASGGLGREVNLLLRAVALPGSELVMPVLLSGQMHRALDAVAGMLTRVGSRVGARPSVRQKEIWRSYTGLSEVGGRLAFIHTVRSVIDPLGQRVSAHDRLYLAAEVPTLIVWGTGDQIIPVEHAYAAHALMPGSHLQIIEGAGHFLPFEDAPAFLESLTAFLRDTEPANATEERFQEVLLRRSEELERQGALAPDDVDADGRMIDEAGGTEPRSA